MFSFNHPILLRGFYTVELVNDAFGSVKICYVELWSIVLPNLFYFGVKLGKNQIIKGCDDGPGLRFVVNEKCPYSSSTIVTKYLKTSVEGRLVKGSPYIDMNQFKDGI